MIITSQKRDSNASQLRAHPLTANCRDILETGEHCCLGISPFNGYFTEDRIRSIASWALRHFSAAHFFFPDAAAAHTLEAVGYSPEKAAWKARRQGQYLRNKVRRALLALDVDDPDALILDSAALCGNDRYHQLLRHANHVFKASPAFARECLQASRWVLNRRLTDTAPNEEQLHRAVRYFLAELPLFTDTAGIVATTRSVFCYHQSHPWLQRFYDGQLAARPVTGQGFAVLVSPEPTPSSPADPVA